MKKILMGLVALSTISLAAIDLNTPNENTNVFEFGGQEGKINISLTVKSKLTPVKYVIFVDDNGTWDGTEEDTLTLPDILLSQVAETNKFESTITKNVYVKKVNENSDGVLDVDSGKNVNFTVALDTDYTSITSNSFGKGGQFLTEPTALMSKASLDILIASLDGATVNTSGLIEKGGKVYRTPNVIKFYSDANGVLKVDMVTNTSFNGSDKMSFSDANEVQNLFETAQPFTDVKLRATVQ